MEISGLAVALKPDDEYMKVVADGLLLEVLEDSGKAIRHRYRGLVGDRSEQYLYAVYPLSFGGQGRIGASQGGLWIKVLGRTQDSLLLNGVVVMKQELIRTVNDFLGHPRFFFVVDKHPLQYYDKLIINVEGSTRKQLQALPGCVVKTLG